MRGADVGEHSTCDAGQETEGAFTGCRKGDGQRRRGGYSQPESDRRPQYPIPPYARGEQYGSEGDPNGYLVNENPESDEPGRDGPCLRTYAQNEAVREVVDGQPDDERPERVFVDVLGGLVVRVGPGERLGHEEQGKASDEPGYRGLSAEFESLGEEFDEREREQYPGGEGGGVRPAPGPQFST